MSSRVRYLLAFYALLLVDSTCSQDTESRARQLGLPTLKDIRDGTQQTSETLSAVKSIGDTISSMNDSGSRDKQPEEVDDQPPFAKILSSFLPPNLPLANSMIIGKQVTAATTSTTTPGPVELLGRNIDELGSTFAGSRLFEGPMKVLNGILSGTTNLTRAGSGRLDHAADRVAKATETTSKVVSTLTGGSMGQESSHHRHKHRRYDDEEDDSEYYEFTELEEPFDKRRPKYFSRECPFRFACEVGKLMKPLSHPFTKKAERNRLYQDLQNRYTRAMTYGSSRGNCDRYYCVLVALFGGPVSFTQGVAELVNRYANPDVYEGYDSW